MAWVAGLGDADLLEDPRVVLVVVLALHHDLRAKRGPGALTWKSTESGRHAGSRRAAASGRRAA